MFKSIEAVLDSGPFQIFFAVWTGIYLVQVIKQEAGEPGMSLVWWIVVSVAVGIFIV